MPAFILNSEFAMTLHILGPGYSSLVRSVRLYCLEKGLQASFGMHLGGTPVALRSPEHLRLQPLGQVPVLLHGEQVVFETAVICRYLDQAFPETSLTPVDARAALEVAQWASAVSSTVDARVIRRYLLRIAGPKGGSAITPEELAQAQAEVEFTLAAVAHQLGEKPFLCGEAFTLADALLAPMLDYLERTPGAGWLARHEPLGAYLQRLKARPSGQQVLVAPDFTAP
ncbi:MULTISPECIES: glutathione S-transferase family protein [unclassified Pseudomonas]|uniref:glutathione S-transferase family protein n=1 Tax=unclassified Pseudomonas TaxID=196821 RepID=UPI000BDC4E46|nr:MULTISPECIES: glutathione S-transferase family protein [unclassified Pseudomonas]PVZ19764.1 glutathione S-transferase [Pseudomonas sp. URIL14HWK12:I12]PVZ26830.1 glutathione S-transferase [Pseudomonas sp. URIL14HWK12:I10]PVZ37719.1 glutathione S-transferase [Pseudomonas sp. URIL14HWK12:I11]SNZ05941.1 glutathione S-transferase [Pseudomonas sp. URIL14HWK12:I9]